MNTIITKGFTLIETMVAISILAVALVGPFTAVQNALSSSYIARDRLIAATLAQEGLEYVRSIRDNNYHANLDWLDGFNSSTNTRDACFGVLSAPSGYCIVDATLGDFHVAQNADAMKGYTAASASNIPRLYISATGLYNQYSGTQTYFTRTVQLQTISDHEVKVTVEVSWVRGVTTYSVVVIDHLQNWL